MSTTESTEVDTFIVSWDCYGLEACIPVSEIEREGFLDTLKSGTISPIAKRLNQTVNAILLRARVNSQRHYEVYIFTASDSISKDDIIEAFDSAPQNMADTIRKIGTPLLSNRRPADEENRIKIV